MERFERAFKGHRHDLVCKLDVSTELLTELMDKDLLTESQFQSIRVIQITHDKVVELLKILCQRPDCQFNDFCIALHRVKQSHIVEMIAPEWTVEREETCRNCSGAIDPSSSSRETSTGELEEFIESDYGLPVQLYANGILSLEQSQEIQYLFETEFTRKQRRVRSLLQLVLQHINSRGSESCLEALYNCTAFMNALRTTDQCHVFNYIKAGGITENIVGNDRPLSEQQRRRVCPSPELIKNIDSRKDELLKRMVHDDVISQQHHDDVIKQQTLSDMNNHLLIIMQRRSLANVIRFISYLEATGQTEIVNQILDPGVFVGITTEIIDPIKDKKTKESLFITWFWTIVWPFSNKGCNRLSKYGCEIRNAMQTNSISWYIKCRTLQSLESLRESYICGDLVDVLQDIFNCPFQSSEHVKLSVSWSLEEYDNCKTFMKCTSGRPFGSELENRTREREDTTEQHISTTPVHALLPGEPRSDNYKSPLNKANDCGSTEIDCHVPQTGNSPVPLGKQASDDVTKSEKSDVDNLSAIPDHSPEMTPAKRPRKESYVSSYLGQPNILNVPLGKQNTALRDLPWEMLELVVLKSAIVFQRYSRRLRLLPAAEVTTFITISSVCQEWHEIMTYRPFIRRNMRKLFHEKLTCDVPLELLKAAVLLRRVKTRDVTTPSSSSSAISIEQDSDKSKLMSDVTTSISEREIDRRVLSSLAAVCRHWKVTLKTRSDVSRRQLSLMMHDERMCRLVKQQTKNRDKILKSLNVTDDVIDELQSFNCITDRQKNHLRKLSTRKRCSRLLDIMSLKNREEYNTFIDIMRRTGRQHIALLLESTHVIPGHVTVIGVTTMKEELFVSRGQREEELLIEVYSTETFELKRKLNIKWLGKVHLWISNVLTASEKNNCIYVIDWKFVCKVNLNEVNEQVKWRVDSWPRGLSVNKEGNVIVTCYNDDTIKEYSPSGSLVRRVKLQSEVSDLFHSVELSNGHYAVCHLGPVNGVSVVDREGRVVSTYRNNPQSNTRLLDVPRSIAVTADDCILVADCGNNRIIILDSSLSCARDLRLSRDDQLEQPWCIHFDESRDRLFVGELNGRVVILDNVFNIHHLVK